MIDISELLKAKNADISFEALRKTELLCERATELSDKYFEAGRQVYLNDAVKLLTQAARINYRYSPIYVSLSYTCIRLELFEEAKALLFRVLEFDPGNLIAGNMLKIVNSKIAANLAALKKREKAAAKSVENLAQKFSKIFSKRKLSSNLKVKVSENTFSKFGKIFSRE